MRKVCTFVVSDECRDKNKSFVITEMSATAAEDWAIRAILALGAANVDIPEGAAELGMSSLAQIGLKKLFLLKAETLRPLLQELMECVQIQPDAHHPEVKRSLVDGDVEEVKTLLTLKWEVLKLHMDFLGTVGPSNTSQEAEQAVGARLHTRTSRAS